MFPVCADPSLLSGLDWFSCYLTTPKHLAFFGSFGLVMLLIAVVAPVALAIGFAAAVASRSASPFLSLPGRGYIALARGVPDIVFFSFRSHRAGSGIRIFALSHALSGSAGWCLAGE